MKRPEPVVVENLVKKYRKNSVLAVNNLSFSVGEGEIYGLLGPNGAGKSTSIGMLTTMVVPSSGSVFIGGVDAVSHPALARKGIGVVPQHNNLDRAISIRHNLLFHARYHRIPKIERNSRTNILLKEFGLEERSKDRPQQFSGGQAQRVMIARALMHEPKVLFLDEPSTGLDPAARLFIWDRIRDLKKRGVTIVLTTHDMTEAAALSDRVGIVHSGRLIAEGTPDELIRRFLNKTIVDITGIILSSNSSNMAQVSEKLSTMNGIMGIENLRVDETRETFALKLSVERTATQLVSNITSVLEEHGALLQDFHMAKPSLEDVFIHLTGRTLQ
ncbi:ABC transporter ATP-binding protein [Nocardiopsis dassonvillei]|uniref:ABC transporter ATP-binding protein n=1 Tax=Nocardiopsis dassonvillei TaxID=2014 RepID=UPI00340084FE